MPSCLSSFIIAFNSVYRIIQERGDIRGVPLASGRRTADFKISNDADDTAIYLRGRSAVLSVVTILDDFASVLGLQTNQAKSIIIELDPRGSSMFLDTCNLIYRPQKGPADILSYLWANMVRYLTTG